MRQVLDLNFQPFFTPNGFDLCAAQTFINVVLHKLCHLPPAPYLRQYYSTLNDNMES
jgi:hypothetical protein